MQVAAVDSIAGQWLLSTRHRKTQRGRDFEIDRKEWGLELSSSNIFLSFCRGVCVEARSPHPALHASSVHREHCMHTQVLYCGQPLISDNCLFAKLKYYCRCLSSVKKLYMRFDVVQTKAAKIVGRCWQQRNVQRENRRKEIAFSFHLLSLFKYK